MRYSIFEIVFPSIIIPLIIISIVTMLLTMFTRIMATRKRFQHIGIVLFAVWLILLITGLAKYSTNMSYPMSVLLQPSAKIQTTIGQVAALREADTFPVYYCPDKRTMQRAKFISVNGKEYYVISCAPEIGQYVTITWVTEERVVIAWKSGTSIESDENQKPDMNHSDGMAKEELIILGRRLIVVSIVLFVFVVTLQYILGRRCNDYLIRKDSLFQAGACPNRWGLLIAITLTLPIMGILIGWGLSGFGGAYVIAFLGATLILRIAMKKQTTYLIIEENELLVFETGKTHHYPFDTISFVRWEKSKLPFNRCLVIEFNNGFKLILEQEHFWGLEYMYTSLNKYLR